MRAQIRRHSPVVRDVTSSHNRCHALSLSSRTCNKPYLDSSFALHDTRQHALGRFRATQRSTARLHPHPPTTLTPDNCPSSDRQNIALMHEPSYTRCRNDVLTLRLTASFRVILTTNSHSHATPKRSSDGGVRLVFFCVTERIGCWVGPCKVLGEPHRA